MVADADVIEAYNSGQTMRQVARSLGLPHHNAVARILKRNGVASRGKFGPRPNAPLGRHSDGNGYVIVSVQPDDPMASMGYSNKRSRTRPLILEHRLVMARHLGRPLSSDETVHHRNGVRDDNRIENLELRGGQHGPGVCRVCLDCGSSNVGVA